MGGGVEVQLWCIAARSARALYTARLSTLTLDYILSLEGTWLYSRAKSNAQKNTDVRWH